MLKEVAYEEEEPCTCIIIYVEMISKHILFVLLYTGAIEAVFNGHYGLGTVPFVTSYIYCRGTEPQLANCSGLYPTVRPPASFCRSTDVAGAKCLGM